MTSEKYSFPREFFFNEATMHRAQRVSMLKKMTGRSELEITLGYLYAQPFQVNGQVLVQQVVVHRNRRQPAHHPVAHQKA